MTEIQLLYVTELLSQFGEQVVKRERTETDFRIHLSGDRWIRINHYGDKEWWLNGKRHRTDGPAVEWADGTRFWWLNGQRHRTDGPAVELADGCKEWWLNGRPHRADGPAVERTNGDKFWWLNGVKQKKPRKLSS
jgi:hypothetical protein